MKEYVTPNAELVEFENEKIITASGCRCQIEDSDHDFGTCENGSLEDASVYEGSTDY